MRACGHIRRLCDDSIHVKLRAPADDEERAMLAAQTAEAIIVALGWDSVSLTELDRLVPDGAGARLQRDVLADRVVDGAAATAFLVLCLRLWDGEGADAFSNLHAIPRFAEPGVLSAAYAAAWRLNDRHTTPPEVADLLAHVVAAAPGPTGWLRLRIALWAPERDDAVALVESAAIEAGVQGDHRLLAAASYLRTQFVGTRAELVDAVTVALRHVSDPRAYSLAMLAGLWFRCEENGLADAFAETFARIYEAADGDLATIPHTTRVHWDMDVDARADALAAAAPFVTASENLRFRAAPTAAQTMAHAQWDTWSFTHPAYLAAVPHNRSVLRERGFAETRLVLRHETTHILSMLGGVGTAVMALRAALLETEIRIWGAGDGGADVACFVASGVAASPPISLTGLALADQSIEILAKQRVLQGVWGPWFEGIAVFAELHDDQTTTDRGSTASDVMAQLIDDWTGERTAEERETAIHAARAEEDARYAEALRDLGVDRLSAYLDSHSDKYLAGYLAVRAVVAAWRGTVGTGLPGTDAAALLLHVTRFGTFDAAPPLDLPLDEFIEAAHAGLAGFLREIVRLRESDIRKLTTSNKPLCWKNSRPKTLPPWRHAHVEATKHWDIMVAAARCTLCGPTRAPATRAGDDPRLADLLTEAAEFLADLHDRYIMHRSKEEDDVAGRLFNQWVRTAALLPLGSATTHGFWLDHRDHSLHYAVRTVASRADTGEPSYDAGTVWLTRHEFSDLVTAVAAHPYEPLSVHRFGDLAPDTTADRGMGRNVLAFALGDWLHVQPRGYLFGFSGVTDSLRAAVHARLRPHPFTRMEVAMQVDATGLVARTRHWMAEFRARPDATADVLAWSDHVAAQAETAASATAAQERASNHALLALLFPKYAAEVIEDGMFALVPARAGAVRQLCALLFATGSREVAGTVPTGFEKVLRSRGGAFDVAALEVGT